MPYIFEQGESIDIGSHGEHDYVYASGDPVNDGGDSGVVFESGTGLGSGFPSNPTLQHVWSRTYSGASNIAHYPAWNETNDYLIVSDDESNEVSEIRDAGDASNLITELDEDGYINFGHNVSQTQDIGVYDSNSSLGKFYAFDMDGNILWSRNHFDSTLHLGVYDIYMARMQYSSAGNDMELYDIRDGTLLDTSQITPPDTWGSTHTKFTNDGTGMVGRWNEYIFKYSVDHDNDTISEDWRDEANILHNDEVRGTAMLNNEVWAPDTTDNEIVVFDASDGSVKTNISADFGSSFFIVVIDQGPDGKRVAWGETGGDIVIMDAESKNELLNETPQFDYTLYGIDFFKRQDDFYIAVGTSGGGTHMYKIVEN